MSIKISAIVKSVANIKESANDKSKKIHSKLGIRESDFICSWASLYQDYSN